MIVALHTYFYRNFIPSGNRQHNNIFGWNLDNGRVPLAMIQTMKKLKSGYINGTRVMLGHLGDFLNTSAITDLSFLGSQEDGYPDRNYSELKPSYFVGYNIFVVLCSQA